LWVSTFVVRCNRPENNKIATAPTPALPYLFLDTIEETYNNGPPLALYPKKDLVYLDLVMKNMKNLTSTRKGKK
jgi:hypothetical protein